MMGKQSIHSSWRTHLRGPRNITISELIDLLLQFAISLHDAHLPAQRAWMRHVQPPADPFGAHCRPLPEHRRQHPWGRSLEVNIQFARLARGSMVRNAATRELPGETNRA